MLSTQARREDAHRKILVGAAVLAACRDDPATKAAITRILAERIRGDRDRALLGLPPRAQEAAHG